MCRKCCRATRGKISGVFERYDLRVVEVTAAHLDSLSAVPLALPNWPAAPADSLFRLAGPYWLLGPFVDDRVDVPNVWWMLDRYVVFRRTTAVRPPMPLVAFRDPGGRFVVAFEPIDAATPTPAPPPAPATASAAAAAAPAASAKGHGNDSVKGALGAAKAALGAPLASNDVGVLLRHPLLAERELFVQMVVLLVGRYALHPRCAATTLDHLVVGAGRVDAVGWGGVLAADARERHDKAFVPAEEAPGRWYDMVLTTPPTSAQRRALDVAMHAHRAHVMSAVYALVGELDACDISVRRLLHICATLDAETSDRPERLPAQHNPVGDGQSCRRQSCRRQSCRRQSSRRQSDERSQVLGDAAHNEAGHQQATARD